MYKNNKKSNSIISSILCLVIIATMLFSIFFIAKEAEHKCTGEDCPICLEIQTCVQTLKTMGSAICSGLALVVALFCAAMVVTIGKPVHFSLNTLVSLKVKLTD